jgi:hypothetical protein
LLFDFVSILFIDTPSKSTRLWGELPICGGGLLSEGEAEDRKTLDMWSWTGIKELSLVQPFAQKGMSRFFFASFLR